MSRAGGMVRLEDGRRFFLLYQGTSDIMGAELYRTIKEAWDYANAIVGEKSPDECNHYKQRTALIYSDYGGGFCWMGTVCETCARIVQGRDPFDQLARQNAEGYRMTLTYDWTPDWVDWSHEVPQ